ncbi:MAG: DUF3098 domain-containing protein [Prevotella sp.]|jgi:uncharacterized membrane protein
MDKRNYAFGRTNFIMLAIGMCVVILGFILMGCAPSTTDHFNPEIFAAIHIKVAPVVCFVGYIFMIFGVIYHKKENTEGVETKEVAEK